MADHDTHDHTGVPGAGSPTEITDIPTTEMDDTLVLAPDGAGGVEFRAEAGGGALAFGMATKTAQQTTSSSSFADITSLSVTLSTGAHRCKVTLVGHITFGSTGDWIDLTFNLDGTDVEGGDSLLQMNIGAGTSNSIPVCMVYFTDVLTAASHTIKARLKRAAGAGTNSGFSAATTLPAFLYVEEMPF
jgi:hypothetical protein